MEDIDPAVPDASDGDADVLSLPGRVPMPLPAPSPEAAPDSERPLWRDVIGDILRDERLDQQRTLADVADDAAVSLPYLSEIERGRKEVSSDLLDAVIRSLGLELADVLERAAERLRGVDVEPVSPTVLPGVEHLRGGRRLPLGSQWGGAQARLAA